MSIDFSKYTVKELHEAWISIDDYSYPERAIEIYQRLKAHGEEAHDEGLFGASLFEEIIIYLADLRPTGPIAADVELENDLARLKEQRVLAMIKAQSDAES